ncbi:cupin-like domain-containing protein (plasmid) [Candidatus Megaera polyxenophila]|nr:cupin-like domain-containing protein [Candidatus Megaera polyxenophila]
MKRVELARNQKITDGSIQALYKEFKDRFNKKNGFFNRMSLNPHRSMQSLDEVHNLRPERFLSDFLLPQIPVVIKGAILSFPAVHKWSPSYFTQKIPNSKIKLNIYDYSTSIQKNLQFVSIYTKMRQAIDLIENNLDELNIRYYSQQSLLDNFSEIKDDIKLPDFATHVEYSKLSQHLWIGQKKILILICILTMLIMCFYKFLGQR